MNRRGARAPSRAALGALGALVLGACAVSPVVREPTLASLRAAARESDATVAARVDAALADMTSLGGDPAAGARALEQLEREAPDHVRVLFARGIQHMMRGEFSQGVQALVGLLREAPTSSDPLAPAMVEVATGRLIAARHSDPTFVERFTNAVDEVARNPGRLGPDATFELLEGATRWARERGMRDAEQRWSRAAGCATEFTVAGAFGPLPMLRFDETLGPEGTGPLAAVYDLGPGRGVRETYTIRARGCAANLGRGRTENGVFFAATDFSLAHDVDAALRVESPNVFAVYVDGHRVGELDGRGVPTGTSTTIPLRLAAGRHTLRIKIASRYFSPLLMAAITDRYGRAVATFLPARGAAHPVPPERSAAFDAPTPYVAGDFERYVRAEQAYARRDPVFAREMLRPLVSDLARATPWALIAWGSVALADPLIGAGVGRDRARRAFEAAQRSDVLAWFPSLSLARLAAADDRPDAALEQSRAAYLRFRENPEVAADYAERLLERSWDGEAREVLDRAATMLPRACWPVRGLLQLAQRRGDGQAEAALTERLRRCDALSEAGALAAMRARRWGDARAEFLRLLESDPEGRGFRRSLVELARQQGDLAGARDAAQRILHENPEDSTLRQDLADVRESLGDRAGALAGLDADLARAPGPLTELFRTRAVLAGREDLDPWRVDGRAALRAFDASNERYDAPAVLVLDYTVRRVYPDGSALELTHNVVRVQSQEAVDEHATYTPPSGARLLTLRTHKADGRVLEPDAIARLEAIAFPDVHVGDAIEFEYIRALPPADVTPAGFLSERFYFRGFDVPYDRSELVMVLPRAMAGALVVDPRGAAPETQRRDLHEALTELRWIARQSHRLVAEPNSVAAREFLPSVSAGVGATWSRYVDTVRDRLADLDVFDPEARRLAREIVGDARTPSGKLERLHGWVLEHVQQEGGGTPFGSAPVMLSTRAGHRGRVLCYLLRMQGVPCTLAVARQVGGDATETEVADGDLFPSVLLRVRTEGGERWVTTADRGAPATYLPPPLAGQPALLIAPGAPRARTDAYDPAQHTRDIAARVQLARDGSARADVTERMTGAWAVSWRDSIRQIDPANLEREFESYVGRQVTAASLTSLHIDGQSNREAPIALRYGFTAPGVASTSADGLVFEGMYLAELGPAYARLPQRGTTLFNGEPLSATLTVDVVLAAGMTLEELPAPRQGHAPGIDWSVAYERTSDGFRLRRSVVVPTGRVRADEYARFAEQVRAADEADTQRVRLRVR